MREMIEAYENPVQASSEMPLGEAKPIPRWSSFQKHLNLCQSLVNNLGRRFTREPSVSRLPIQTFNLVRKNYP